MLVQSRLARLAVPHCPCPLPASQSVSQCWEVSLGSLRSRRWLLLLPPAPLLLLRLRPVGVEVEVEGAEAEGVDASCGANRLGAGEGEDAVPLAGLCEWAWV